MRAVFGPQLNFTKGTPVLFSPIDGTPVSALQDVEISASIADDQIIISWPGSNASTHNKLMEVRAYPILSGSPIPTDANALYADAVAAYAAGDAAGIDQDVSGSVTFPLPDSIPDGEYVVVTLRVFAV